MKAKVTALQIRSGDIQAFRSTLEARWAYFFDLLGMHWQYEPFTYKFENLNYGYTPDFEVQEIGLIEVKPTFELAYESKARINRFILESGRPVYLFCGGSPVDVTLYRVHSNPPKCFRLSRMQQMIVLGGVDRRKLAHDYYETFITSVLISLRSASGRIRFDVPTAMQKYAFADTREEA